MLPAIPSVPECVTAKVYSLANALLSEATERLYQDRCYVSQLLVRSRRFFSGGRILDQNATAHWQRCSLCEQILVDGFGGLAAFGDRPDHQ